MFIGTTFGRALLAAFVFAAALISTPLAVRADNQKDNQKDNQHFQWDVPMRDHGPIDGLFTNPNYDSSQPSAAEQLDPYHPTQQHAEHQGYFRRVPDYSVRHEYEFAHFHNRAQNIPSQGWAPGYWDGAGIGFGLGYGGWGDWNYGGDNTYDGRPTTDAPLLKAVNTDNNADIYHIDNLPDWSGDPPRPHSYTAASSSLVVDNTNDQDFPIDEWPSLGFVTYTGRYGTSPRQVVMRVVPGSPAANAGFAKGDVILSVNGQRAPDAAALNTIFQQSDGQFTAQVWEVGTGHFRTLSGKFDPNVRPPSSTPMGTPTEPSDEYDAYE